ncbi:phage tape measure protein [Lysinibacillus sphaericus]|uniref:phage tail protein n=1 Tax=Lysinibacillus sphaericus TaxID=1421 RepID=UPI0018CDE24D|nr:phage tail tape measure protein [Lysinibacillus sphaericus]MBG9456733.1 phage tape measure protein [Lysinibacillus sphaericus]MBG9476897.1 phage tape measure protein [Lysinibacillus sphaericus]MBG9591446.1 phage tape measure protein [Lysinibacillus sphaericus]
MELSAIFKVRDRGSAQLRKITQMTEKMNRVSRTTSESMTRSQSAISRLGNATSSASSKLGGFATQVSSLRVGANGLSASLKGAQSALIGIAGAYVGAQGMAKLFNATIGAASNYEQNAMAISGMFGDDKQAKKYLQMVEKAAIASPVLNSTDMMSNSKAFIGLSKNVDELQQVWGLVERIQAFSGVDTQQASFSTKELMQGDYTSMYEAVGLDKKELQKITKMDGLSAKMSGLDKLLTKMGVTDEMVNKMGNTTKGLWSQLQEKSQTFFKNMGMESNTKLGDFLRRLNTMFEGIDTEALSNKLGNMLGKATDKAIALYDLFVKWRKPIAHIVGAIGTFVAALAVVGTISALANPISLIAMGIAAAVVGFKALYDNSEAFRGAIDGIIGKVKTLWSAFKEGGVSGLISALFPPDIATKVNGIIDGIKTKISTLTTAFKKGGVGGVFDEIFGKGSFESIKSKFEEVKSYISEKVAQFMPIFERLKSAFSQAWSTVSDILSNAWSIIEPYLSGFWNMLQIIGDVAMIVFNNVIAPAISFLVQLFSTLWSIAKPILSALGLAWEALSTVIKWMWDNVLAPLVDFILTAVKNAFDTFSGALEIVQGWFETLSGWISTAYGHVKDFIGFIGKAKLPDWVTNGISAGVNFVGGLIGAGDGKKGSNAKSNYHGLDYVPYDSYYTRLHKGERVMTAQENKDYSQGNSGNGSSGPVVISGNSFTVREEADIEKIAYQLAKLIERQATQVGY